jgi:hypothetical protein
MNAALTFFRRVCGSVAVLIFFAFSGHANASFPSSSGYVGDPDGKVYSTAQAACDSKIPWISSIYGAGTWRGDITFTSHCSIKKDMGSYYSEYWASYLNPGSFCPDNSTGTTICTCSAGFTETDGACVPPPEVVACGPVANTTRVVNLTAGFMRSPGNATYPTFKPDGSLAPPGYPGLPPDTICYQGCIGTVDSLVESWSASEPGATGLYRVSDDWNVIFENDSCSVGTELSEAPLHSEVHTAPPCTGFLGSVNGKPTCVATVPDSGFGSYKPSTVGNPKAGAIGGGGASGNIPPSGNGSNGGGPATANDGALRLVDGSVVAKLETGSTAPSGTVSASPEGTEQAACGAPGQPVCAVKLDESRMQQQPNADGLDKIDQAKADFDSGIDSITGDGGKDTSWGLVPSWLNHVGACVPTVLWTLPAKMGGQAVTMDLCPLLPGIYLVMNWLWVIWTFFIVVGLVLRTTTKAA